jgi:hypothetical protein
VSYLSRFIIIEYPAPPEVPGARSLYRVHEAQLDTSGQRIEYVDRRGLTLQDHDLGDLAFTVEKLKKMLAGLQEPALRGRSLYRVSEVEHLFVDSYLFQNNQQEPPRFPERPYP